MLKGPSSLLYGSDAMGGVIDIQQAALPVADQFFAEAALLGKTVNGTVGGSLMQGFKKNVWFAKIRYSEQHFGDYRVPADTVVYLTQKMPLYGRRMKNTAGFERNVSFFTRYHRGGYKSDYMVSNVFQKNGFFPGGDGIPDI